VAKPTLTVTSDFTKQFNDIVKKFRNDAVLVGIPESAGARSGDEISNAALLAINNFGSPVNNIPARPVMQIGIRHAQKDIAEQFRQAFLGALKSGLSALTQYYERAGIIASNSVKLAINNQTDIAPPAESTIRSREAAGFSGKKALIRTAQMRNAITYVVNKGGL